MSRDLLTTCSPYAVWIKGASFLQMALRFPLPRGEGTDVPGFSDDVQPLRCLDQGCFFLQVAVRLPLPRGWSLPTLESTSYQGPLGGGK